MNSVDREVQAEAGLSVHDLEDFPSHDMFTDGVSPKRAARRALKNSGF
jgi:hypothetical protein